MTISEEPNDHAMAPAKAFGIDPVHFETLTTGLINATLKVQSVDGQLFILQKINTQVFSEPAIIQSNYLELYHALQPYFELPKLIPTIAGNLIFQEGDSSWRCFSFVPNSYSITAISNPSLAYTVAHCFGNFSKLLATSRPNLQTILPNFHNISFRINQLQQAIAHASPERHRLSLPVLQQLENYHWLHAKYEHWAATPKHFLTHIMHHDCKVANILFNATSNNVICPIDFDTTQNGLFFSDLGDMIRSMAPNFDENHEKTEELEIRKDYLSAIEDGYRTATQGIWTQQEQEHLSISGHVLFYMQAIRFITDYLNGDTYYKIFHPHQNLVRAKNQMALLTLLPTNPNR